MASRKVVTVKPIEKASVDDLQHLFAFHGQISRVAVVDGCGYVEYVSSHCVESALMFDRTKLAGQTISVAAVDAPLDESIWAHVVDKSSPNDAAPTSVDKPSSPKQSAAPIKKATPKSSSSGSSSDVDPQKLPPPSPLPPPEAPVHQRDAAAAGRGASASGLNAVRSAALQRLAKEPLNQPQMLLAVTIALQVVFALLLH